MSLDGGSLGASLHPVFTAALLSNQCPTHKRLHSTTSRRHIKAFNLKTILGNGCSGLHTTLHMLGPSQKQRGIHIRWGGESTVHSKPALRFGVRRYGSGSCLMPNSLYVMAKPPDIDTTSDDGLEGGDLDPDRLGIPQVEDSSNKSVDMGKQLAKVVRDMGGPSVDPKSKVLTQLAVVLNKAYDIGAASAARAVIAMAGRSVEDVITAKKTVADADVMEETTAEPETAESEDLGSMSIRSRGLDDFKPELSPGIDSVTQVAEPAGKYGPAPDPWIESQSYEIEETSQDFAQDKEDRVLDNASSTAFLLSESYASTPETIRDIRGKKNSEQEAGNLDADSTQKDDEPAGQTLEQLPAADAAMLGTFEDENLQDEDENFEEKMTNNDMPVVVEETEGLDNESIALEEGDSEANQMQPESTVDGISGKEGMTNPGSHSLDEVATTADEDLDTDSIFSDSTDPEEDGVGTAETASSEESDQEIQEVCEKNMKSDITMQDPLQDIEVDEMENQPLENDDVVQGIMGDDARDEEIEGGASEQDIEDQEPVPDTEEIAEGASNASKQLAFGLAHIRKSDEAYKPVNVKKPSKEGPTVEESLKKTSPATGGLAGLRYVREYAEMAKGKMRRPSSENPQPQTSDFLTPPPALLNKDSKSSQPAVVASEHMMQTPKMQNIGTMWWQTSTDDSGNGPNGRGGGGGSGPGGNGDNEDVPGEGGWWLQVCVSVLTMTAAVFSLLRAVAKPKDRRASTL